MGRRRCFGLFVALACGPRAEPPKPPVAGDETPGGGVAVVEPPVRDPAARIAELERRLLAADRVQLTFDVTARGVMEAEVRGILIVERGKLARIDASGTFGGETGEVSLSADATTVRGHSGPKRLEVARPAELDAALLLGLVRMGVLHNLALLWHARPPDHGDGGVAEWVTIGDYSVPAVDGSDNVTGFAITVEGQAVGNATLWLDEAGWPARREQTVRLPAGEMKVTERYEAVEITEPH